MLQPSEPLSDAERLSETALRHDPRDCTQVSQLLDLFAEDSRLISIEVNSKCAHQLFRARLGIRVVGREASFRLTNRCIRRLTDERVAEIVQCEQVLPLREHDTAGERRLLTICPCEIRFDPRGVCGPNAPECPATTAW